MRGKKRPPPNKRPDEGAPQKDLRPFGQARRLPDQRRNRVAAASCAVAAHALAFAALFWFYTRPQPPHAPEPAPIIVSLLEQPKPPAPPEPKLDLGSPVIAPNPKLPAIHLQAQAQTEITIIDDKSDLLSASQLAGASQVGEGGGGGSCDLSRAVQQALRRDPLVRTAVQDAHRQGQAVMLWNGDWVRTGGQEGKGLSAVREAISWEVAFAPQACRNIRMHGLVLLSLADGNTRFAVGTGEWRWSDLLGVRGGPQER